MKDKKVRDLLRYYEKDRPSGGPFGFTTPESKMLDWIDKRFERIEEKVMLIMNHLGLEYVSPYSEPPKSKLRKRKK